MTTDGERERHAILAEHRPAAQSLGSARWMAGRRCRAALLLSRVDDSQHIEDRKGVELIDLGEAKRKAREAGSLVRGCHG